VTRIYRYCAYCGKPITVSSMAYCSTKCQLNQKASNQKYYAANKEYHNICNRSWHAANREYHNALNWNWRNSPKTRPKWLKCMGTYNAKKPNRLFRLKGVIYSYRIETGKYDAEYKELQECRKQWAKDHEYKCVNCKHKWSSSYKEDRKSGLPIENRPFNCPNCQTRHWETNDNRVYNMKQTKRSSYD